jgi:hypothetical protein
MGEKRFFLLDIDGVLLEAQGYRLACVDTVNDFLLQMGQPDLNIDRSIPDAFETAGITAEWDMIPLILAAFLNWYYSMNNAEKEPDDFPVPLNNKIIDNDAFQQMLLEKALLYQKMLNSDETPINAVRNYLSSTSGEGLESLWSLQIRDRFFTDTLDPWKCPYFSQLMNRLLGKETFENFYGITAQIPCDSYLETKDHLLISEHYRTLLPNIAGKTVFPAVMTYRPTRLPSSEGNKGSHYYVNTPEGECALRLLGWTDGKIPMIGAGSLCYIEEKYNLRREYYVKPHPFHALASMMIAISGDEVYSLETARNLCELDPKECESPVSDWFDPEDSIKIYVFEDSVSGINSAKNAAALLRKWGYSAKAKLMGIHSTEAKDSMLVKAGADLYSNINTALDTVLEQ